MIQAPECRGQSSQGENQAELRSAQLEDQAETHPRGECKAVFAFRLHFHERIPGRQTNGDQLNPAVRSKGKIADPICSVKRTTHETTSAGNVRRPEQARL